MRTTTTPKNGMAPAAEAIFIGTFITLDPSRPNAQAVGVSHGRIVSVGSLAEVERGASSATSRTSFRGVGLPGLADAHVHVASLGQQLERLDLRGLTKAQVLGSFVLPSFPRRRTWTR